MLMLPKTIEQQLNARRIAFLGAGIDTRQSQNVEKEVLMEGTQQLLSEKSFSLNAKKIGDSFAQTGGVQPALDALEEIPNYYTKEKPYSATSLKLQKTVKMLQKRLLPLLHPSFPYKEALSLRAVIQSLPKFRNAK